MYKYILVLATVFSVTNLNAQLNDKCGTMHNHAEQIKTYNNGYIHAEKEAQEWLKNHYNNKAGAQITIPVVFHVVYNPSYPSQDVPDSLIYSQLEVLNEDFRRLNADTTNTRSIFDSIAADVEVEFCLANKNPQGNWTTGINRVQTTETNFALSPFNDGVKSSTTGGADPWPADKYLNIWVCDMGFNGNVFVLGYAQFPGGNPATDGVVITYQHLGRRPWDTLAAPANLGRTASHEVGHWLGLRHIWGDGDCDSNDYVMDTPNADAASQSDCDFNKNTCPDTNNTFWGATNPPDMVENYMDYSADACMNMFSEGQKARMWSFLNTSRSALATSDGCSWPASVSNHVLNKSDIDVYPNPSTGKITLSVPDYLLNSQIVITNILGKVVYKNELNSLVNYFNLNSLSKGIYTIKLTDINNNSITKQLVLSR